MTLNKQLEELINRYKKFLERNSFKKVNEMKSGMGILMDYDNEKLKLRFINDRGICDVLIAESANEENLEYYGLGVLRMFKLELNSELTDEQIRKSQRYSANEDFEFVSQEYSNLIKLFSPNEVIRTKEEINKIQTKRAKIKYGT